MLRDDLGRAQSVKDGCSPQGQCGCCTVLVDGAPRVACVTPARRVAGRRVTTVDGLGSGRARPAGPTPSSPRAPASAGSALPGSSCRLAAAAGRRPVSETRSSRRLLAHLCRCTGWRTIVEAAAHPPAPPHPRRATWPPPAGGPPSKGARPSTSVPDVALGRGGFADDLAPADALVAVTRRARRLGRRRDPERGPGRGRQGPGPSQRTGSCGHPLDVPPGPSGTSPFRPPGSSPPTSSSDASWCRPGGEPASPLGNGGAFGAKLSSPAPAAARGWPTSTGGRCGCCFPGRTSVRLGPKRPPIAAGVAGRRHAGIIRVAAAPGDRGGDAARGPRPRGRSRRSSVVGPPASARLRAAGWAEAAVLLAAARPPPKAGPAGGQPRPSIGSPRRTRTADGPGRSDRRRDGLAHRGVEVTVRCGDPLDEVVLRSYAMGAAHMAMGWVCSRGASQSARRAARGPDHPLLRDPASHRDTPPIAVDDRAEGSGDGAGQRIGCGLRGRGRRGVDRPGPIRRVAHQTRRGLMSDRSRNRRPAPRGPLHADRAGRRLAGVLRPGRPVRMAPSSTAGSRPRWLRPSPT